jgi:exodeoxyribonuclease VII large subunit
MKQQDLFGQPPAPETRPSEKAGAPKPRAPAAAAATVAAETGASAPVAGAPVTAAPVAAAFGAATPVMRSPAPPPRRPEPVPTAAPQALSVSELTRAIKDQLEPAFARVLVRGEISGYRGPNVRGHLYFAVKDAAASIDVKMWQSAAQRLKFALKEGLEVTVEGYLQIYEPQGRYSIIASRLEPAGVGALALAFEQLKARLAEEGLFGPRRTKPRLVPPFLPRRIGVATSLSGAALKDFLKVLHRRNPRAAVLVCDCRVQGDGAAVEISRALAWLQRTDVDVIVLTRGGGSAEDLWAFNEEPVLRQIFASKVPVVSAVGHEVDVTLSDLVADVRAPTPSAAAELLAPDRQELELQLKALAVRLRKATERGVLVGRRELQSLKASLGEPRRVLTGARLTLSESANRMHRALHGRVNAEHRQVAALKLRLERASPRVKVSQARQALAQAQLRLEPAMRTQLAGHRQSMVQLNATLDALSPLKVLGRGYSITTRSADKRVVRKKSDVKPGDEIDVRLSGDEIIAAKVTK